MMKYSNGHYSPNFRPIQTNKKPPETSRLTLHIAHNYISKFMDTEQRKPTLSLKADNQQQLEQSDETFVALAPRSSEDYLIQLTHSP